MTRLNDLTGKTFDRWTVVSRGANNRTGIARWNCQCICGNSALVIGATLTNGASRSCGCLKDEATVRRSTKHGAAPRNRPTRTYRVWLNMLSRCRNPNHHAWKHYGGRGITVCERWLTFENFIADMGDAPRGLWIERKNNDAGYCPENCEWETPAVQRRNQRRHHT